MGPLGQVAVIGLGLAFAYVIARYLGNLQRKEREALAEKFRGIGFEPDDPNKEPFFSDDERRVLSTFQFGFRGPYDTGQNREELNILPIVIGRCEADGVKQVLFRYRTKGGRHSVWNHGLVLMVMSPVTGTFRWKAASGKDAGQPEGNLANRFELAEELNSMDWTLFHGHAKSWDLASVEITPAGLVFESSCHLARSVPLFFEMAQRAIAVMRMKAGLE